MSRSAGPKPKAEKTEEELTLLEAIMAKAATAADELQQLGAGPEWTVERCARILGEHQNGDGPPLYWVIKVAPEGGGNAIHYYYGDELIVRGRRFR